MRIGGIIFIKVDGVQYSAKGSWTYNLGKPKREGVVGSDSVHGYKELPQIPFVEGAITDSSEISSESLLGLTGVTVTLELANGKVIVWRNAWFAGEGSITTEEGEIAARFESKSQGEEVR